MKNQREVEKQRNSERAKRKECAAFCGTLFSTFTEGKRTGIVKGDKKAEKGQPLPQFVLSPKDRPETEKPQEDRPRIMIRETRLFCKLIKVKKSAKELYEAEKGLCAKSRQPCPSCGCRGKWRGHGEYERSVIDYETGKVVYNKIRMKRIRCESCGHTHANIPDYIIPYCTYSLFFVLRILGEYYAKVRTVERICQRYNITPSMLYQWKEKFEEEKEIWLGVLETAEQTGREFIRRLSETANYSEDFSRLFFQKTGRSFLQRRRETARYRHAVF